MRSFSIILFLLTAIIWLGSCQQKGSTPGEGLAGNTYQGVIPCADCPGIFYEISLNEGADYASSMMYIGESSHKFIEEGTWSIKEDTILVLKQGDQNPQLLAIGDNQLAMLDGDGKRITGELASLFILHKADSARAPGIWKEKRERGIDFRAAGNEPFWGIDIDFDKAMTFYALDGDTVQTSVPQMKQDTASGARTLKAGTETGSLKVALSPVGCVDSMSGKVFDYSVQVTLDGKTFKGCGDFINPSAKLNDFWALYSLNGNKIDKSQIQFDLPALHFSIAKQKVYGNTGCNQLSGTFSAKDSSISFSKMITTKRACMDQNLEQPFLEALNNVDSYKITNAELLLLQASDTLMVFRRAE